MYIHTDIFSRQSADRPGESCGDAFMVIRDESATTIALADGLGSGIKANISANLCVSRLVALIRAGFSLREAFDAVAQTMDEVWGQAKPMAMFTLARILNTGQTTVLSYEMPSSIIVNTAYCYIAQDRVYTRNKAIVSESNFMLEKEDGLILLSDGIIQAGMGKTFPKGWQTDGVMRFVQKQLPLSRLNGDHLAQSVHDEARSYPHTGKADDCSVIVAVNRRGIVVNLLTGPPHDQTVDDEWVADFFQTEGIHLISGGSTALMAARSRNEQLTASEKDLQNDIPAYKMSGCELITEGMVTLNQVYNLLDENIERLMEDSPVMQFSYFLKMADRVNIWLGRSENSTDEHLEFRRQGLLSREKIIQKTTEKLRELGKLVVIRQK